VTVTLTDIATWLAPLKMPGSGVNPKMSIADHAVGAPSVLNAMDGCAIGGHAIVGAA
jgi:hypothetical protein